MLFKNNFLNFLSVIILLVIASVAGSLVDAPLLEHCQGLKLFLWLFDRVLVIFDLFLFLRLTKETGKSFLFNIAMYVFLWFVLGGLVFEIVSHFVYIPLR
jgi:hypothetical protein